MRIEVVRALVAIGDQRTLPWLRKVSEHDPDQRVREAAREGFRRISIHHGLPFDERELLAASTGAVHSDQPLDRILAEARVRGASDVHVMSGAPLAFRVHGQMTEPEPARVLTPEDVERLVRPIVPPRLARDLERDLQADFSYAVPGLGRHRVNVFMERRGLAAVIRLIPSEVPSIATLGLPPQVKDVTTFQQGLVLVTGRAGSGKTTTLAALVNLINETRAVHVITLEDPIEYLHPRKRSLVNQREVGRHTLSFPAALRAALREDPDVIVVGELRDLETITMSLQAAETGVLVLATLHTNSASRTVDRLINVFPASEQDAIRTLLAGVLRGILSQQLLPCRTGGRVPAVEVLFWSLGLPNLIREGKPHLIENLIRTGRKQGMVAMDDSLMALVQSGMVEPDQALDRALDKSRFREALASRIR